MNIVGNMCGNIKFCLNKLGLSAMELCRLIKPEQKCEKVVLFTSLIFFYFLLFIFLLCGNDALGYTLMGYDTIPNSSQYYFPYVHCWHLRHPLMAIFSLPITLVRFFISLVSNDPYWVIYTLPVPMFSAFSNLLIYKIQKSLGVSSFISALTVLMFCGFAHVVLLCWQYESFPYSMFFLLLLTYYTVKGGENVWADNILLAGIAGVTSTNVLKYLTTCFVTNNKMGGVRRFLRSIPLFCVLMILPTTQLLLSTIKHGDFWGHFITNATSSTFHNTDTITALWDNFLCEPLFFHNIGRIIYDPITKNTVGGICAALSPYATHWITTSIVIIYLSVIISWITFRKEKIIKIFFTFLCVDLFILLVLGYGKNEAHLFCFHWMFCIPVSIGMFMNAIKNKSLRTCTILLISVSCIFAFAYNTYHFIYSVLFPSLGDNYTLQFNEIRGKASGIQHLTDERFFLFGMADRPKLIYKDKVLKDIYSDSIIFDLTQCKRDIIIPDEYKVVAYLDDRDSIIIREDENAIWTEVGGVSKCIEGSMIHVNIPEFKGYRYGKILKVLHQEILFNIKEGMIYPNILAYSNVWYRDAAMGAMVLEKTNNIHLIKRGLDSLCAIYDLQNNVAEGDNIGEYIYMKSLSSDKKRNYISQEVKQEINMRQVEQGTTKYITGITDGAENNFYATAWLKYALGRLSSDMDIYQYPKEGGVYKYLCWFAKKPTWFETCKHKVSQICSVEESKECNYPYMEWAVSHSFEDDYYTFSAHQYPLSWEGRGAKADFTLMKKLASDAESKKMCFPHVWTAAEMFLYLYEF